MERILVFWVILLSYNFSQGQYNFRFYQEEKLSCKALADKYLKDLAAEANYVCRNQPMTSPSLNAKQAAIRIQSWKKKAEELYQIELEQSKNENIYSSAQPKGLEYTIGYEEARRYYFIEYADNCGYFNKLLAREIIVVSQRNPDCRVDFNVQNYKKVWRRNDDVRKYYATNSDGGSTPLNISPDWPSSAY